MRLVHYDDLPEKGDVTDYLESGGTLETLIEKCNSAPLWQPKHTGNRESASLALKLRRASEITPLQIEWFWRNWLPRGMLTLFAGHGGIGKSTIALSIAAALTIGGKFPDGTDAPIANVLILAAEDSPEHTIVPRLSSLGADLNRAQIVDGVLRNDDEPGWIQLREHIVLIEHAVREHNIGVVIIDPISSYIGDANSDRESDVRAALMPLVQMAERTGVAVMMIRHVSKGGGDGQRAASRILGSTAWHDVPRLAWMLAEAPDDYQPEPNADGTRNVRRVLGVVKSNLAAKPNARWGLQPADGPFRWLPDQSPVTIDECYRPTSGTRTKEDEAKDWLRDYLAGGMQRSTSTSQAAKAAGFSQATYRRAREALKVKKHKDADGWWLMLQPSVTKDQEAHLHCTDAAMSTLENASTSKVPSDQIPPKPAPLLESAQDAHAEHLGPNPKLLIQDAQYTPVHTNERLENRPLIEKEDAQDAHGEHLEVSKLPDPEEEWSMEF